MSRRLLTALALLALGAVLFVSLKETRRESESLEIAPPLSLPDLNGKTISLESFKGKVVLLDFWATWCEPCLEELPDLIALHEKFQERSFALIGVSLDPLGAKAVRPFARKNKIPYPILLGDELPPAGYFLRGIPTAFLINREGRIVKRYLGPQTFADLAKDIEELLDR
ncbi:MAG: TlpA family protein disulfide reductase [Elusimicrobia bacterium]|nr:TlpA family protein disulfide reductase [Elusimicrobiota bacterium]